MRRVLLKQDPQKLPILEVTRRKQFIIGVIHDVSVIVQFQPSILSMLNFLLVCGDYYELPTSYEVFCVRNPSNYEKGLSLWSHR